VAEHVDSGEAAAKPSESIHIPDPSYMPVTLAFGIMVSLVGILLTWVISAIGIVIVLVTLFRWIGRTRSEMAELPLEHH